MTKFTNIEAALTAINDEAAADAWEWLENNKPQTAKAIRYLIEVAKIKADEVLKNLNQVYATSEPNAQHKMRLVVEAMERERDAV